MNRINNNDLNSVVADGVQVCAAFRQEDNLPPTYKMTLRSHHVERGGTEFTVIVTGYVATQCRDGLIDGGRARVVGRLMVSEGTLVVYAEHVEIKQCDEPPVPEAISAINS